LRFIVWVRGPGDRLEHSFEFGGSACKRVALASEIPDAPVADMFVSKGEIIKACKKRSANFAEPLKPACQGSAQIHQATKYP